MQLHYHEKYSCSFTVTVYFEPKLCVRARVLSQINVCEITQTVT